MVKKLLLATLAGGVAAYLIGWLLWGSLLMDFYTAHTTVYPGLFKEKMNLVAVAIGCFIQAFLVAWVYFNFSEKKSILGGAITGAIIGALVSASLDLNFLTNWNLYTPGLLAVDVVLNAVYTALFGAVVGWVLKDKAA